MGFGITALGLRITSHGIGMGSFLRDRDQAVPFWWDEGFVTLLKSRIRSLCAIVRSALKKRTSLQP